VQTNMKRKLAIGTTALAAAAFAGGAYAANQDSRLSARQAFLNDLARRLNVTPKQLTGAVQGAFIDQLQAAVAAGKLTQAQADAIKQRVQQSGAPPLGALGWVGPPGGGAWLGPGGGGERGPRSGERRPRSGERGPRSGERGPRSFRSSRPPSGSVNPTAPMAAAPVGPGMSD
jgi:hypothetical protein